MLTRIKAFEWPKQVSCEYISNHDDRQTGVQKTCHLQLKTMIDSPAYKIKSSNDETVGGVYFKNNKKIYFLPIGVSQSFPQLKTYIATNCSIKTLSKENFSNLKELETLWLYDNEIEMIPADLFRDLKSLKRLFLWKNKIRFIKEDTFDGLNQLLEVQMTRNECININFTPSDISTLPSVVAKHCGVNKADNSKLLEELNQAQSEISMLLEMLANLLENVSLL